MMNDETLDLAELPCKLLDWNDSADRDDLIDLLNNERVVISSTDTIYGFLGMCTQKVYDDICKLKKVAERRPFLILISLDSDKDCDMKSDADRRRSLLREKLSHFVDASVFSDRIIDFLLACWPGPVTVIFDARPGLPEFLVSEKNTIAIRSPQHDGLLSVLPQFNGLFSTSANRTAEKPPAVREEINKELLDEVGVLVCDKSKGDESAGAVASTIIDFSGEGFLQQGLPFRVVRVGAYSVEKLKDLYERV